MFFQSVLRVVINSHDSIQELHPNTENDRDSEYFRKQDFKR